MTQSPLPISIIIITWNSAEVIEGCLESLRGQGAREIHIIDNGSQDATLEIIARSNLPIVLHQETENKGFSYACNEGLAKTELSYVFYLNDDATLRPGYLETLYNKLENHPGGASAVGKMVYLEHGRQFIDSAGIDLGHHALRPLDRGHGEPDIGQYDQPCEIFGPSATATLYRRSSLLALCPRPFDEEFFAYYEDVDLAWRLGRRGYKHFYVPDAVVDHCRRGPDGKPSPLRARAFSNRYLLWAKNENPWRFLSYAPLALSWESVRLVKRLFSDPALLSSVPKTLLRSAAIVVQRSKKRRK